MRTQFDVGQEVYVRAIVEGIQVTSEGVEYKLSLPVINPIYTPKIVAGEDKLVSCEVEDFRRQDTHADKDELKSIYGLLSVATSAIQVIEIKMRMVYEKLGIKKSEFPLDYPVLEKAREGLAEHLQIELNGNPGGIEEHRKLFVPSDDKIMF